MDFYIRNAIPQERGAGEVLRIYLPRTQVNRSRGESSSARVGTFRDVPSEAQHSRALFPDIIDA